MINKVLVIFFIASLAGVAPVNAADVTNNCLTCHSDWEDDSGPSHKITADIHYQKGLGCVDCHGGDATLDDMDKVRQVKGYRGVPNHREVPDFCAHCHSDAVYMRDHNPALATDQLDKYKTSVHGQRLFGENDQKVANCISCHTVHEIGDAKMPHSSTYPPTIPFTCGKCHADSAYMAGYKIPTDQLEDYRQSVHGQALLERNDLGAPACNDCHGNHGAAPPGVTSLAAVCGNCHAIEAGLFESSPHFPAFQENDYPMCETCHSNHKVLKPFDGMVGTTDPAVCVECHAVDDGTKGLATADGMAKAIKALVDAQSQADSLLNDAIQKGMMTTDEEFRLKDVNQSLIQTRTQVHSASLEAVTSKAEAGIAKADTVKTNAASLIGEYHFRRKGLVVATFIITILAVALYIKIKRMDKGLTGN